MINPSLPQFVSLKYLKCSQCNSVSDKGDASGDSTADIVQYRVEYFPDAADRLSKVNTTLAFLCVWLNRLFMKLGIESGEFREF